MSRVDLDAIGADGWADPDTVLALVAEVRAARKVINAILADTENEVSMETDIALDEYEQAVGVVA